MSCVGLPGNFWICSSRDSHSLTAWITSWLRLMRSWAQARTPVKQTFGSSGALRLFRESQDMREAWAPHIGKQDPEIEHLLSLIGLIGLTHPLTGSQWIHKMLKCYISLLHTPLARDVQCLTRTKHKLSFATHEGKYRKRKTTTETIHCKGEAVLKYFPRTIEGPPFTDNLS